MIKVNVFDVILMFKSGLGFSSFIMMPDTVTEQHISKRRKAVTIL
jgi:hypothetical protein